MLASIATGATAAATTAGKCTEALQKLYHCADGENVILGKVAQKFCKGGAQDAAKFGEKLETSINKCGEKWNSTIAKLDCATEGDPNIISSFVPVTLPLLSAGTGAMILSGELTEVCNGVADP